MNSKVVENERKDGSSSILTFSRDVEVVGGGVGWGGAFSRRHEITAIVIVI